jgi:hypothetical protein
MSAINNPLQAVRGADQEIMAHIQLLGRIAP